MSDTITIHPYNASHVKLDAEMHIYQSLYDHFAFRPEGYKFVPAFKNKIWDGFIRLFNVRTRTLPLGLIPRLEKFANASDVELDFSNFKSQSGDDSVTLEKIQKFTDSLDIHSGGKKIIPHDYQIDATYNAIKTGRMVAIAPTSAGKSLILYIYINWFMQNPENKMLLIVPSVSLVHQMMGDFSDYASNSEVNPEDYCHLIMSGKEKQSDKQVTISTWQSLQNISKGKDKNFTIDFFKQWNIVTVDECFHPTTKILMEDNTWKEIQHVLPGDYIKNLDEHGNIKTDLVLKQHKNLSKTNKMYKLTLEDGSEIKVTGNHKVMTTLNIWKTVDELNEGDDILWQ